MRRFEPFPAGGFVVHFVRHRPQDEGAKVPSATLEAETRTARVLVLSAGTLGSTYLMLSNRSAIPHVSGKLGTKFCGNGDVLGFVTGSRNRVLDPSNGPVITSTMRMSD